MRGTSVNTTEIRNGIADENKIQCSGYFLRVILPLIFIVLVLTILYVDIPILHRKTRMMNRLFDDGHFLLFAMITYFVLRLINYRKPSIREWSTSSYLISVLTCSILAILSESLQIFNSRDAQIRDLGFNFIGILFTSGSLFLYKSDAIRDMTEQKRVLLRSLFLLVMLMFFSALFIRWARFIGFL